MGLVVMHLSLSLLREMSGEDVVLILINSSKVVVGGKIMIDSGGMVGEEVCDEEIGDFDYDVISHGNLIVRTRGGVMVQVDLKFKF